MYIEVLDTVHFKYCKFSGLVVFFDAGMVSNGAIIPSGIVPLARPQVSGSVTVQASGAQSQILGSPTQVQLTTPLLGSAGNVLNPQTLQAVSVYLFFSVILLIVFIPFS